MVGEMIGEMVGVRTDLPEELQKSLLRLCVEGLQLQGAEVSYSDSSRWLKLLYFLTHERFVSGDAYHKAVQERIMEISKAMLRLHLDIRLPVTSLPSPHALGAVVRVADEWEARRDSAGFHEDRDRIVSDVDSIFYRDGESVASLLSISEELGSVSDQLLELAEQASGS